MNELKYWIIIILAFMVVPFIGRKWYQDYSKKQRLEEFRKNCLQFGVRHVPEDYIDKFGNINIPKIYLEKNSHKCKYYLK